MKARDIMTANPEVVTPDQPVSVAARLMKDLDIGAVPVVQGRPGNRLVGILTDRDLAIRHLAEGHTQDCPVRKHMTPREDAESFGTARPEDSLEYVVELMKKLKVRRIPVVDENDERLIGIIAQADLALRYGEEEPEEMEAILKEISEPTHPHPMVAKA